MKIAVEGCAHGELDAIYATIARLEERHQVKVDLLIICGDVQTIRNRVDLSYLACPVKYRALGGFYEYYSGKKKAPLPTVFIGGNHEASSYLWELFYGGWVCENVYYLGKTGCIRVNGVRIAGLSGIYKDHDYRKGYFEKMPFTDNTMRSVYHVREYEVEKLALLQQPLDIMLSHDWPRGIEHYGDLEGLLRKKSFLRREVRTRTLGNPGGETLLQLLQPRYWFAAHMHIKYPAVVWHSQAKDEQKTPDSQEPDLEPINKENQPANEQKQTRFLSLDKCLPGREFLQILDIPTDYDDKEESELHWEYDAEWLAITRALDEFMSMDIRQQPLPPKEELLQMVERERQWIDRNVPTLDIPRNFCTTGPVQETPEQRFPHEEWKRAGQAFCNPQTSDFCLMLGIPNRINPDAPTSFDNATQMEQEAVKAGNNPDEIVMEEDAEETVEAAANPDEIVMEEDVEETVEAVANPDDIGMEDEVEDDAEDESQIVSKDVAAGAKDDQEIPLNDVVSQGDEAEEDQDAS